MAKFDYLYNKDNGICMVYSDELAANRADLVPITNEELKMLRNMSIGEVLALRTASEQIVEVRVVPVGIEDATEEKNETHVSQEEEHTEPKGVIAIGNVKTAQEVEPDAFGNERADYSKYRGVRGEQFDPANLADIPDDDLVRFAKEVLFKEYEDADPEMPAEGKDEYYKALRVKMLKDIARENRKKVNFRKRNA